MFDPSNDPDAIFQALTKQKPSKQKFWAKLLIGFLSLAILVVASLLALQISSQQTTDMVTDSAGQNNKLIRPNKLVDALSSVAGFYIDPEDMPQQLNILVLGIPGVPNPGSTLTDSIVVVSLRPKEHKLVLVSLPRDFLVKTPGQQGSRKINSLYYAVGIEKTKQKISQITGLTIDHHMIINLKTVEEIIDLIDGLNIYVPRDIYDPYYPGPYYTYQTFSIKAGWRYLDGATALKYMRTRYTSPGGDFDRMVRQQQILRAVKQKVFSLNPLWNFNTYLKIYQSLQSKITTDLTLDQIKLLWQAATELETDNIFTATIDKEYTNLAYGTMTTLGNSQASVILPTAGYENYQAIQEYIAALLAR